MNAWLRSSKPRPRFPAQHQELPTQRQSLFCSRPSDPSPIACPLLLSIKAHQATVEALWVAHPHLPICKTRVRTRPRTPPSATRARSSPSRFITQLPPTPQSHHLSSFFLPSSKHSVSGRYSYCARRVNPSRYQQPLLQAYHRVPGSVHPKLHVAPRFKLPIARFPQQRYARIPDSSRRSARSRNRCNFSTQSTRLSLTHASRYYSKASEL